MNQSERREYLIGALLKENRRYQRMQIPKDVNEQKQLLRSLMNIRFAASITEEFVAIQDEYLQDTNAEKGFITLSDMDELQPDIFLWQGDITRLKVGAIVNAANSGMTGCYQPCHNCIDNCIHTYAGIQLRNYCAVLMEKQGHEELLAPNIILSLFVKHCCVFFVICDHRVGGQDLHLSRELEQPSPEYGADLYLDGGDAFFARSDHLGVFTKFVIHHAD